MSWDINSHAGHRRAWGLLLLRVGLTLTLLSAALQAGPACPAWGWWGLGVLACGLLAGLVSCPCAAASLLWLAFVSPGLWLMAAVAASQALAVMLLGAGRWSLDRRLFGRHLVFESEDTFG